MKVKVFIKLDNIYHCLYGVMTNIKVFFWNELRMCCLLCDLVIRQDI